MTEKIFSWQIKQWQQLWRLRQQARLPHALLLSGVEGLGKKDFAKILAHSLLCLSPTDQGIACGDCRVCGLIKAGSHSDLLIVEPEEIGQQIKIDQIREIVTFVNETPLLGGYRVIIINPANAMNHYAANALLKSLEEPTAQCLFILISNQSARLLATILSRCQRIQFSKPEYTEALTWLRESFSDISYDTEKLSLVLHLSHGAPLKAIEWLQGNFLAQRQDLYQSLYAMSQSALDPLQLAARWHDIDFHFLFNLLHGWVRDLIVFKLTKDKVKLINIDYNEHILKIAEKISLKKLTHYMNYVQKKTINIMNPVHLNRQLVVEELFIEWVQHVSS